MSKATIVRNQRYVHEYLEIHHCVHCGIKDPVVLEFDHISGQKFKNISYLVKRGFAWEVIYLEINKCQVLCANCHRRKTAQQFNTYRFQQETKDFTAFQSIPIEELIHKNEIRIDGEIFKHDIIEAQSNKSEVTGTLPTTAGDIQQ